MGPKGKSAAEKKEILLRIIRNPSDPFMNLKEIEKQGSKMGVVEKSIKDIIAELVEDGEIQSDKIGASNFFYSFPSANLHVKQARLASLKEQYKILTDQESQLESDIQKTQEEQQEPSLADLQTVVDDPILDMIRSLGIHVPPLDQLTRSSVLQLFTELQQKRQAILQSIQECGGADPVVVEKLKSDAKMFEEASNRWTDNIFGMQKYLQGQGNQMTSAEFFSAFELDSGFDYDSFKED